MLRRCQKLLFVAVLGAAAPHLVATEARAQGASLEEATPKQTKEATAKYKKAKRAFDQKDFEEALAGFRDSYGTVASPNSHLMIARTLAEMGKPLEALTEFEATAQEADAAAKSDEKYARTAESARAEMAEVKKKVGLLTVNVSGASAGTTVTVAGNALAEGEWGKERAMEPGKVTVVLTTSDGREEKREVELVAGTPVSVDLTEPASTTEVEPTPDQPEPEPAATLDSDEPGDRRVLAYIAGGVGVAGLATFGIFGALNNSKFSDLEDQCPGGRCPADLEDDASTGQTYQTVANVGLVVGIVGLGAGTVLFLTSGSSEEKTASRTSKTPRVSVGPGSVWVNGRF